MLDGRVFFVHIECLHSKGRDEFGICCECGHISNWPHDPDVATAYQVIMRSSAGPDGMVHLSIKRKDRMPIRNWLHLQVIKNVLVGSENEAVEIFPAQSRVVNAAHQYHLWVLKNPERRIPIGFP